MKKALFIYWTGTGNSRRLVKETMERFLKAGLYEAEALEVDIRASVPNLSGYDLVVFVYPIYAFNLPAYYSKFVKRLNLKEGGSYLILKQSGEPIRLNNASSYPLTGLLKRSGRPFLGECHFLYPYNIHFRYPDDFVKEIMDYNALLQDILVNNLQKGVVRKISYNPVYHFLSFLFRIQRLGSRINSRFYRVDTSKCLMCGRCARNCPMENILIEKGRIVFRSRCEMCMRCSFECPVDAIGIGLLDQWRVNGPYPFEKIAADPSLEGNYSFQFKKGFYSWFNPLIEKTREEHRALEP